MVNWYAWPVALGGAVAVTFFVYGNHWKSIKALLRFLGTFLLLFLLFSPSWNAEKSFQRKPIISLFIDASESAGKESIPFSKDLKRELTEKFGDDIQLNEFFFGSEVAGDINDSIGFSTRLDKVTEFIKQEAVQPEACILISDGIANRGGSPLSNQVKSPIFSLGIGDPKMHSDALVSSISVNESVFKGNDFEVEAAIQMELLKGKKVVVDFFQKGKLQETISLIPQRDLDVQRVVFRGKGEVEGLNDLLVKVRPINTSEKNIYNNIQKTLIEVVSQKKKIALLYHTVHPDLGALRKALIGVEQFELIESKSILELPQNAHAVIAFNIKNDAFNELKKSGLPFWLFSDATSQLSLETSISNRANPAKNQAVTPEVNNDFELFSLDALPFPFKSVDCPLLKLNIPREKIQIFQQWNRVNTNLPLCFADDSEGRKLYFVGFGIWKWRIQELKQTNESKWFDQWVRSNVDWLSNQNLKGKNIEWSLNKRNWIVGLQGKFKFSLYDGASKKVENANLSCTITDEVGRSQSIGLTSNLGVSTGVFRPSIGGRHTIKVQLKTPIPGVTQREFTQFIDVDTVSLELQTMKANHDLLNDLSHQSEGGFYLANNKGIDSIMAQLTKRELYKPRIEILQSRVFATDEVLLLCLIVLLFGVEWFLRKWEGKI